MANALTDFAEKGMIFFRELHRDWKVTALRSSIDRLLYQMVLPYLSIYTLALGATHTQRGERKPETFDFLGFMRCCGRTKNGRFIIRRETQRKRMIRKLK